MIISYIYEPYVITFIIAIIITIIYYVYKKNKDETQSLETHRDEKGKKNKFHLGSHCILVFISCYSILTSLYYLLKNYISPYQNIQVDEMIKENITDKINEGIEILKENVIPSFTENRNEEDNQELEQMIEGLTDENENENEKMIYVGGKRKLHQKDKLKHLYSSKAKIIDNDVDTNPNSFDF